jgi:hypothetical protein
MNSQKEPEPGPSRLAAKSALENAGRILRTANCRSEGSLERLQMEEFIGG